MTNACKTRMRALVLLVLVGCGGSGSSAPDAASTPDAPDPNPTGSDPQWCQNVDVRARCSGGTAMINARVHGSGGDPGKFCDYGVVMSATCAAGCATTGDVGQRQLLPGFDLFRLAKHAAALCNETPEAKAGDPCSRAFLSPHGCAPTRAKLATDGSVIGHDYLACSDTTKQCIASPGPTISGYLAACDAATLAQHGAANVNGVVAVDVTMASNPMRRACLLAWDSAAQAISSGRSISCIGDWECPAGSLCDDQIAVLGVAAQKIAACKPGPRGTLTPAMLTP
jgi:hypothetical protein